MTNKTDFGDFAGTDTGAVQEEKWNYPGIGYNASDGIFYIDNTQASELIIVPFAMRECKEVAAPDGMIHRYPLRHARALMAGGDVTVRMQIVCAIDGELYTFGMRSYTARASFTNPAKGQWHNEALPEGIWNRLVHHIKDVKATGGPQTSPLCWQMKLVAGDAVKMVSGGNSKQSTSAHPILLSGDFEFVGAKLANEYTKLYQEQDLDDWRTEWAGVTSEAAPVEQDAQPTIVDDELIPF